MLYACPSETAAPSSSELKDAKRDGAAGPHRPRRRHARVEFLRSAMTDPVPALLGSLSAGARALAQANLRRLSVPANAVVYYQEDPCKTLYFVEAGHVRLSHIGEDGSVALYGIIPSGQCFGEISAFDTSGYCDTATTIDPTTLAALDATCVSGDTPAHAELRERLGQLLAHRLRMHVQMTRALYMPNLSGRLALSILHLLDTMGTQLVVGGQEVECLGPVVTQRDLGTLARGTRENVNKMLRTWIKDGVLSIDDRHIIVRNRGPLEARAYGV